MSMKGIAKSRATIIVLFVLVLTALAGVFMVGMALNKQIKTKELNNTAYYIGAISETDGKDEKDDHALRTAKIEADKFEKIELSEDATVTYQLFYYNADKKTYRKDRRADRGNDGVTRHASSRR
mgnify:CR=1 FL=1